VQRHMEEQLAKKPERIGFVDNHGAVSVSGGSFSFSPQFEADGATFTVNAVYIDHETQTDVYPPHTTYGISDTPILYRVSSGALVQVGPNSFRVCPHGGPIVPQGNPWEPTIVAYTLGNNDYQPTEHPAHVNVNIVNMAGQPQTLDFSAIPDQPVKSLKSLTLRAKASSGLPVEFYVVSGPAHVNGNTLIFDKIPRRSKYPVRVLVDAFQWGRQTAPQVQSAGPAMQQFWIDK